MIIRKISAGDKTTSAIAFARGPKVLATDTVIEIQGRIQKKLVDQSSLPSLRPAKRPRQRIPAGPFS